MTTVGIVGGGQLARMLALAGHPLGISCVVVEPGLHPPAAAVADVIAAPYGDPGALDELTHQADVVTVELEGVPVDGLRRVERRGVPVRPAPDAVAATQDRLAEKQCFAGLGVSTAPWGSAVTPPAIVKTRHGGYDGRGQMVARSDEELAAAHRHLGDDVVCEAFVTFERELSIVAARGVDGSFAAYPLVENRHDDGILRVTLAPAPRLQASRQAEAEDLARRVMESFGYVGVLTVELFETAGGLLANEMAPRVHNSGHWTIEGAITSQFEQHLRAVTGMPLGSVESRPSAMVNLIGTEPDRERRHRLLALDGVHLHLYGKTPRPGRKLGHVTVVGHDEPDRDARLATVLQALGV